MQIQPPTKLWYENADGMRWLPRAATDKPPEGFRELVQLKLLLSIWRELPTGEPRIMPVNFREPDGALVLAMCRPSMAESKAILQRALLERRQGLPAKLADRIAFSARVALGTAALPQLYSFDDALRIVTLACDRCRAALAYTYGLPHGFSIASQVYAEHASRCEFCRPAQPAEPKPHGV